MTMSDAHPQGREVAGARPVHEEDRDNINVRLLLIFLAVLVLFLIGVYALLAAVMGSFSAREKAAERSRPAQFRDERGLFPRPRLQPEPAVDLRSFRREEAARAGGYGWVDPETKKVARIPIDRAMEIVARRGLPTRKAGPGTEAAGARPESP